MIMTTMELLEKYGIGHNCLSDAYALGMMHGLDALENAVELAEGKARAEGYQQAENDYHKQTEKDRQSAFSCGYEKGRADAIEEYKGRLLELCDCGIERAECTGGNCLKCMDNAVDYSSIVDLAEELKEEKNE